MNGVITTQSTQLPDTLEDLTQFVLVGKSKLEAYRIKLQTINRLSIAQEIRDQTLREAQEVNEAVRAAEIRIGELLLSIPSRSGMRTDLETSSNGIEKVKTKTETASEMGYSKDDVSYFQRVAKNPEVVRMVLEEAKERGEIASKAEIAKAIKAEQDKARDLKEERDYFASKLEEAENREPETVEVVPPDYAALKKKAKAFEQDYKREKDKVTEKQKEILALQDRIAELEGATQEGLEHGNLSENVFYFCAICNNFIGNVGGLVWLTERIADMPKKERELFLKAARAFTDWSLVFKDNLERSLNEETGNPETDTGIPLLADQE